MHFHIHIPTEEREDDVEQLLVVPLGVGVVSVRHREQVSLQQAEHLVEILIV